MLVHLPRGKEGLDTEDRFAVAAAFGHGCFLQSDFVLDFLRIAHHHTFSSSLLLQPLNFLQCSSLAFSIHSTNRNITFTVTILKQNSADPFCPVGHGQLCTSSVIG